MVKNFPYLVLLLLALNLTACNKEKYWCDNCSQWYYDNSYHHMQIETVDFTLCPSCYQQYVGKGDGLRESS